MRKHPRDDQAGEGCAYQNLYMSAGRQPPFAKRYKQHAGINATGTKLATYIVQSSCIESPEKTKNAGTSKQTFTATNFVADNGSLSSS